MDNLKVKDNINMINEVNFINHIESIPYYSKEFKNSMIDIIKDDITFQSEHHSFFFEKEDNKGEYFRSWLCFLEAFVTRDECVMGTVESEQRKASTILNLKKLGTALAIDILDAFWSHNNGYVGSFEYKGECIKWKLDSTEFYIELSDQ